MGSNNEPTRADKVFCTILVLGVYVVGAIWTYTHIRDDIRLRTGEYTKSTRTSTILLSTMWPFVAPALVMKDWLDKEGPKDAEW